MAKIKKTFSPTLSQIDYARFSINMGIAICIYPIPDRQTMYWVEKHSVIDYKKPVSLRSDLNKKPVFLRRDLKEKDSYDNREVFSEIDAWKKVFEMYKLVYDKNN